MLYKGGVIVINEKSCIKNTLFVLMERFFCFCLCKKEKIINFAHPHKKLNTKEKYK